MFDDLEALRYSWKKIAQKEDCKTEIAVLEKAKIKVEESGYDNWNGGQTYYTIFLELPPSIFVEYIDGLKNLESNLLVCVSYLTRGFESDHISKVTIVSEIVVEPERTSVDLSEIKMIQSLIESQMATLIDVATGGRRIKDANEKYSSDYTIITGALKKLGIKNPNPFSDLWSWYKRWSEGDLPKWRARRDFVSGLFLPLINHLDTLSAGADAETFSVEKVGWAKIDNSIWQAKEALEKAKNEAGYQVVGLLCRETLISLAQQVYRPEVHEKHCGQKPSATDAKRMLEAYLMEEIAGPSNEELRKYMRSANSLANDLTHRRTASFRFAAICFYATRSLINAVAVLEGK